MERDVFNITTHEDFRQYLYRLVSQNITTTRSLEEYLRALWGLLTSRQAEFALLGHLLHDAFEAPPLPFAEQWLQYDTPPDLDEEHADGFDVLQHMIYYQIAEIHLMAQAGQVHGLAAFWGIDSPTGHRWYNVQLASYLKGALALPITDGSAVGVI